jgi:hypothetical protein
MFARFRVLLAVAVLACLVIYGVFRMRATTRQHLNGHPASGHTSRDAIAAEMVLSVGDLFITYDSTAHDSAVWVTTPAETLRTLIFPPPEAPFALEPIVRWNDAGQVAWFNTGPSSADLLIELAPQTNHRLAIVRITCSSGTCNASARERGLIAGTKLWVADDGTALLLSNTSLTLYSSIKDLMGGNGETTLPRLTNAAPDELGAPSREVTVLLTNPGALSGEMVEGKNHSRMRFKMDNSGPAVALTSNNNFRIVTDGSSDTRFWDCPSGLLSGKAECSVYQAPPQLPRSVPVSMSDTECGIVISRGGWTWLVRRNAQTQDVFRADGIAGCPNREIVAYQKGHISYLAPQREPLASLQQTVQLDRFD